jgi:hypothetical protein
MSYLLTFSIELLTAYCLALGADPAELTDVIGALMHYSTDCAGIVAAQHSIDGNLSHGYLALVGFTG